MNQVRQFAALFDEIGPWEGQVSSAFFVDFLGTLTSRDFLVYGNVCGHQPGRDDGVALRVYPPKIGDHNINGEIWFEAADWLVAARRARGRFVMVTLGALYGYQAVAACRALRRLNPMPYQLVAVEPIPENVAWIRRHMRDNDIDPDEQWIIPSVISDRNEPVFFFVGAPGLGAQNCIEANEQGARRRYFEHLVRSGRAVGALRSLLKENRIGLRHDIIPGKAAFGDIKLVSSITLGDILSPLDHVDLLEADLQQSEILVFPPFRDMLKKKVSRIHLGTHGDDVHRRLHQMFADDGWEIVFSYEPDREHDTELGPFRTNDGILTVQNPKF